MAEPIRVVHYLNQFFGGIGGEARAYESVQVQPGPVGTLIAGDNYFTAELDAAKPAVESI